MFILQVTQSKDGDQLQTHTYFTTFTYYNTLLAGGRPFVVTSKETTSNIITVPFPQFGNYIERTQVTNNMYSILYITFYRQKYSKYQYPFRELMKQN